MRKITLLLVCALFTIGVYAQTIVSTTPENKNVILEEFTGISCGYCPDGHKIAHDLAVANPGDFFQIAIHTGSYAIPSGPGTDFRSSFGDAIAAQSGLTGYPAGTVNRHVFSGSATATGRGDWEANTAQALSEASYVNVAVEAVIDVQTNEITVHVEAYYTGDSPEATNLLNVALLQNNVEGPQGGSGFNPDAVLPNGNYLHQHMLRHMITGQWGEEISTTTTGTFVDRTFTYTVPAMYNDVAVDVANIEIVAFITETHQEIETGSGCTPTYTGIENTNDVEFIAAIAPDAVCGDAVSPSVKIKNNGSANITSLELEYSVNGGTASTYTWTGNLSALRTTTIDLPSITFVQQASNTVNISVVTVNGSTDEDLTNNVVSTGFAQAVEAVSTLTLKLKPDNWGSETTWRLTNSAGTVLYSGGPYTDEVTTVETETFTLTATDCYVFTVYDAYGDGMDAGVGVGYFTVTDANGIEFISGGDFSSEISFPFKGIVATNVENISLENINVYPNPVKDVINVNVNDATITIYNVLGTVVKVADNTNTINVSELAEGNYIVKVQTQDAVVTKQIVLTK